MAENRTNLIPELVDWQCDPDKTFYVYENGVVKARYDKLFGTAETPLMVYHIEKKHYKVQMPDIVHHLNYFLTFFDAEKELFLSMLSVKSIVDQHLDIAEKDFIYFVLTRIITDSFVRKCKSMARYLYKVNVNTDPDGKYRTSPKITNEQAKQMVALSFCFRFILPLCIHFSNVGNCFIVIDEKTKKPKRETYLPCFDRIFQKIIKRFEENDTRILVPMERFICHRAEKQYQNNKTTFGQKEMLRGDSPELYIDTIIHEVIFVKSLYKLDYTKSCVSFFDGIIGKYGKHYTIENYHSKPMEIDSPDTTRDSDERPSRAESIEMAVYRVDESIPMIDTVNRKNVLTQIMYRINAIGISKDSPEFAFYLEHIRFSEVSSYIFDSFYAPKFKDSYAAYGLSREDKVILQMYLKKFFEVNQMPILAQITTANIRGKYRENTVKNAKFVEKITSNPVYEQIVSTKFRYVRELDGKGGDPIVRKMAGILNCTFEFVDTDPEINGFVMDDIDVDQLINEVLIFLSII